MTPLLVLNDDIILARGVMELFLALNDMLLITPQNLADRSLKQLL